MSGHLLVATANVYIGNTRKPATKAALRDTGADLIGLQEGSVFGTVPGYRRRGPVDGSRGRREVPILVRRHERIRPQSARAQQMAADMGTGMLHDRWANVVRVEVRGVQVSLINTHVHPLLQDSEGELRRGAPQVGAARRHLVAVAELAESERAAGWAPVVTLDANYRRPLYAGRMWHYAPHQLFPRYGLRYVAQGVDGIAFDREAFTLHTSKRVRLPGSDHAALLALLGVR